MAEQSYPTDEVINAKQTCLLRISRVRERLEFLESVVNSCEKNRLPFFREPLHSSSRALHISVRNLRHSLSALTEAMMPKSNDGDC